MKTRVAVLFTILVSLLFGFGFVATAQETGGGYWGGSNGKMFPTDLKTYAAFMGHMQNDSLWVPFLNESTRQQAANIIDNVRMAFWQDGQLLIRTLFFNKELGVVILMGFPQGNRGWLFLELRQGVRSVAYCDVMQPQTNILPLRDLIEQAVPAQPWFQIVLPMYLTNPIYDSYTIILKGLGLPESSVDIELPAFYDYERGTLVVGNQSVGALWIPIDTSSYTLDNLGYKYMIKVNVSAQTGNTNISLFEGEGIEVQFSMADALDGELVIQEHSEKIGTLSVFDAETQPETATASAGAIGLPVKHLVLKADYESLVVTKLRIVKVTNGDPHNLQAATIKYTDSRGGIVTATKAFLGENADFTGLDILIPRNQIRSIEIIVNVSADAIVGSQFHIALDSTHNFEAVGRESSTKLIFATVSTSTHSNTITITGSDGYQTM